MAFKEEGVEVNQSLRITLLRNLSMRVYTPKK